MSQQMGLHITTIFDPPNAQPTSLMTHFQYVLAILVFLSGSAHHVHGRDGKEFAQYSVCGLHRVWSSAPGGADLLSFPATSGLGIVMLGLALPYLMGGIQLAFG
jgi:Bacterial export proteins, family 1